MINYFQMSDPQVVAYLNDPNVQMVLLLLVAWDIVWRGIALWKSAENKSKPWFVALLILNTVGVLPIVYVFFFADKKGKKTEDNKPVA